MYNYDELPENQKSNTQQVDPHVTQSAYLLADMLSHLELLTNFDIERLLYAIECEKTERNWP